MENRGEIVVLNVATAVPTDTSYNEGLTEIGCSEGKLDVESCKGMTVSGLAKQGINARLLVLALFISTSNSI